MGNINYHKYAAYVVRDFRTKSFRRAEKIERNQTPLYGLLPPSEAILNYYFGYRKVKWPFDAVGRREYLLSRTFSVERQAKFVRGRKTNSSLKRS